MAGLLRYAGNDMPGLILLLLAACGPVPVKPPAANGTAQVAPVPPAPAAKDFAVDEKTDLIEFDYRWPAEAAAVPELDRRFRADMAKAKADLVAGAVEEKRFRDKQGYEFHPHSLSTVYATAGQSARLLSLRLDIGGYSGGAHGHFGIGSLLWDRQAKREIDFADVFADPANRDRLLTQRWCDALNKSREEKRGEPVGGGGLFDDCPSFREVSIIPTDSNKDGRFDTLLLTASPYVAGSWVEGAYEIELSVTSELVAVLKTAFQPSFAAQGTQ